MRALLVSTYDLGHQPFGLASPAAWLKEFGVSVDCQDLSLSHLSPELVAAADLIAFYVPMHTATRIAVTVLEKVQEINPDAHICFYGLYAPINEDFLRKHGVQTILGGEFEAGLTQLVSRLAAGRVETQEEPVISTAKQKFVVPDRSGLPALQRYAFLTKGDGSRATVGYTEASRGCKHKCRHCPIVPVYDGRFRIVQQDVVLADVAAQVDAGAQHITFGDPDFLNGPGHAIPLVQELHRRWPELTYDATIKIEHLLKHSDVLPVLRDTGCLFVTSAVESVDDRILEIFDKCHTRDDFVRVVHLFRELGLILNPTFVSFTPWTSLDGYLDLLWHVQQLGLVENVAPIQYAIRLLIPAGSRLLELPLMHEAITSFDESGLCYRWSHPDPRVDELYAAVMKVVSDQTATSVGRAGVFRQVWTLASDAFGGEFSPAWPTPGELPAVEGAQVPYLSEPWYCCAEPTEDLLTPAVKL